MTCPAILLRVGVGTTSCRWRVGTARVGVGGDKIAGFYPTGTYGDSVGSTTRVD